MIGLDAKKRKKYYVIICWLYFLMKIDKSYKYNCYLLIY